MARATRSRELALWANGVRVGTWRLPARGAMELEYDDAWVAAAEARPLSLSLPLTLGRALHKGAAVEAYFDNLLPDSEAIRRRLQDRFHAASRGAFDLLAAIGRDCVGAVQLLPADEQPAGLHDIAATPLSDADIARELISVTAVNVAGTDAGEFRISIAGAQEKTALLRHKNRWCRPVGSTPTTHIFKLPLGLVGNAQADMRTSVENEWLCARIVAAFGIPVASCEIGEFGAQKALVVKRFDRALHSSGKYWLRLMQEDFAQATGTPWHLKYQSDGGPGLAEIARILRGSVEAERDLATLFRDGWARQEFQHPHSCWWPLPAHAAVRRIVRLADHRQEGERTAAREGEARDGPARPASALLAEKHSKAAFRGAWETNGCCGGGEDH